MVHSTRAERVARQREDGGDPDDRVWVGHTGTTAYHEDAGCRLAADSLRPATRRVAQQRSKAPCRYCMLEDIGQGEVRA